MKGVDKKVSWTWAVVGGSNIALTYMISAINSEASSSIKTIFSRSGKRVGEIKKMLPSVRICDDLKSIAEDSEIKNVYVSGLNETHFPITKKLIEAGKNVLCEKPLSLTINNAKELNSLAHKHNVVLGTNYHLRCAGSIRSIKKTLSSGIIGAVQGVRVGHAINLPDSLKTWRINSPSGGVLWDIGIHNVDLLRFIFETEVDKVFTRVIKNSLTETFSMSTLQLENGILCSCNEGFVTPRAENYIEILGDKGCIIGRGVLTQDPVGEVEVRTLAGSRVLEFDNTDLYLTSVREFVGACGTHSNRPAASGIDGEMGVRVVSAMKISSKEDRLVQVE